MIQSFTVTNHNGKSMVCDLANPWKEGLAVASIEGLGPGQANINVADVSSMDGGLFNSARRGTRNITINLIFVDHDTLTIEDIRRKCYTYFPLKKNVKLKVTTSNGKASKEYMIDGYVESNEPNIFSSSEGTTVSIICPNPYFYRPVSQEQVFNVRANSDFTFAFWRVNSETPQTRILFGDVVPFIIASINYEGDADTGLVFEIGFKSDVDNTYSEPQYIRFSSALTSTENRVSLDKIKTFMDAREIAGYTGIVAGDKLILSTIKGDKYLTYIHDGIKYNVLSAMESSGKWVSITTGLNTLRIDKTDPDLEFTASCKNKIYFYGV